jgi:hypothetical protein
MVSIQNNKQHLPLKINLTNSKDITHCSLKDHFLKLHDFAIRTINRLGISVKLNCSLCLMHNIKQMQCKV